MDHKTKKLVQSSQEKGNLTFRDMLCNELKAKARGGEEFLMKDMEGHE